MAARGGRGGARGGRGRGGWGSHGLVPTALDEDGNRLTELIEGPPPDFPEIKELPKSLPVQEEEGRLVDFWRRLRHAAQIGPYVVEDKKRKRDTGGFEIQRYSDRFRKKEKRERLALGALITFSPYYFPAELSSEKERKLSRRLAKSSKALDAFWSNQERDENEFEKFEELAAGEVDDKANEDGDEEEQEEEEEESDEGDEGDDYMVGQDFDDDDGYGESDDGGDDEGIY